MLFLHYFTLEKKKEKKIRNKGIKKEDDGMSKNLPFSQGELPENLYKRSEK